MKKLEIVVKPELLDEATALLETCSVKGLMTTNIMGYGNQKGYQKTYRGTTYTVKFLPKIKIETITDDDTAQDIIDMMTEKLPSDEIGGGKIFVIPIDDVVRLRTGETGSDAI
ncbi:MAG: P-II family nitrogen regulator [Eubacteriaceae bacterium]|jgi:nitrogen regulatory protein P-II 1